MSDAVRKFIAVKGALPLDAQQMEAVVEMCASLVQARLIVSTRPLAWDDVDASVSTVNGVPWVCANGDTRVYAKLRAASWVGITMWIRDPDLESPALKAVIMLRLQRRFRVLVAKVAPLLRVVDKPSITLEITAEKKEQPELVPADEAGMI